MERLLELPESFTAIHQDYVDFEPVLGWFDWTVAAEKVVIDFGHCKFANYQSLALLLEYVWTLRARGCVIEIRGSESSEASGYRMWTAMGARGWSQVLTNEHVNFLGSERKPLIAVRKSEDRQYALKALEEYLAEFPIGYKDYLTDIVNELLYNALEHGSGMESARQIPPVIQFSWYQHRDEISILVGDRGIGVKRHLEQSYPAFESDAEALRKAIEPETSGTFGRQSEYSSRNNAGMGLYVSSQLMMRLRADMWVVSGHGQLHVSPREITTRKLQGHWPGTFVLLTIRLRKAPPEIPHGQARADLMRDAREARLQRTNGDGEKLVVSIFNYFGKYPEDKTEATTFRDKHLLEAVRAKRALLLDFKEVETVTHSFLNALLAGPVRAYADLGLNPYKYVRATNENESVRETLAFILDTNT